MIVDYLTYTFVEEHEGNLSGLAKAIDPGAVALETRTGYAHDWSLWGSGRLKWGHRGEAIARLSLPGSALALHRESGGDVGSLVILIGEAGGRCTRVDFAFDWMVEAPAVINRIVESLKQGAYTSRWQLENSRSCTIYKSVLNSGYTLYLGSPQSACRLVFYDKAAERGEDTPRLRAELRIRKERADAAICLLTAGAEEAVEYVKMLILGYIDIKDPQASDSNKRRWPTADWWAEMWGTQKGRITLGSKMPTEDQLRGWLEKLGPSLAILLEIDGGDLAWFFDTVKAGRKPVEQGGRWRAVHQAKLKAWLEAREAGGAGG
jgi:hypothetical protein